MRIISGIFRGKTLHPGKDFSARPTTDFAKESLFNILANSYDFQEMEVLDLFSGTGSISFEFASRESISIEAVEMNHKHAVYIEKMAKELNFSQLKVHKTNVFQFLKTCTKKYDIIFADPPYDMNEVDTLPTLILEKELLKPEGVFILEHSRNKNFADNQNIRDHRAYGSVNFSFFALKNLK